MKHRYEIGLVLVAICTVAQSSSSYAESAVDRIKREGKVVIGITNDYPLAFKAPDGSIEGVEYDVTTKIFSGLGAKIETVVLPFGGLIPALKAGRIDLAAAGMFIRAERCKQVAFSLPDYQAIDTLVVAKGNPKKLHSFADVVANTDVTIAAAQGGAAFLSAKRAGIPESRIQLFPGPVEQLAALTAGRVDAIAIDTVLASKFVSFNKDAVERAEPLTTQVIDGKPVRSFGAFVFRPEDEDLVGVYNAYLTKYVGSPEQVAVFEKYGMSKDEVPPAGLTAEEACNL